MQNLFNSNDIDPENTLTKVLNIKQSLSFEQMFKSLKPSLVGLNQNSKAIIYYSQFINELIDFSN